MDHRVQIAEAIAKTWNQQGIVYSVVHGIEDYPHKVGRDLDVLIHEADVDRALEIVLRVCKEHGWIHVRPPDLWGKRLVLFGKDLWRDALEIHTFTKLSWRGVVLVDRPVPTQSRGPFLIDPWAYFVKHFLMPLFGGNLHRIRRPDWDEEYARFVEQNVLEIMGERLGESFLNMLRTLDAQSLQASLRRIKLAVMYRALRKTPLSFMAGFCKAMWKKWIQVFYPCGPVIALVGDTGFISSTIDNIKKGDISVFTDVVIRGFKGGFVSLLRRSIQDRIDSARQRIVIYVVGKDRGAEFIKRDLTIVLGLPTRQKENLQNGDSRVVCLQASSEEEMVDHLRVLIVQAFIEKNRRHYDWKEGNGRGLCLAVLGPDGAGKSTLITNLEQELKGAFRRTAVFHLMPGLLKRKANQGAVTDPHGKPPRSPLVSFLKLLYYLLDYHLGYWLKVRPALVRSTLVLFDRYYDDLLVDPKRYRYGGPLWLARWLRRLIPRPDLWLILDVPEEEILRRKQEVPVEELRRQREAYRRLAMELPNAFLLDGSLPPDEVARQARELALDDLHERYLARRHLWFPKEKRDNLDWLRTSLGAKKHPNGKPFLHLTLPDGRGYLLPVTPRRTAEQALSLYTPQKSKARIAKNLLRLGLKIGIARCLLPKVRLDFAELRSWLVEIFGHRDIEMAVSLGVSGSHRKPVLQVLTRTGEVLGYVKVGWNETTKQLVRNEAQTLAILQDLVLSFATPQLLYFGELGDKVLCVQGPPPSGVHSAPGQLTTEYIKVLCTLAEMGVRWQYLEETTFWQRIINRAQKVQHLYWRHLLLKAISEVKEQWKGEKIPLHFAHGDFTPWNAFWVNGQLYLYDWEYAQKEAPAGYDLFHFMVRTMRLVKGYTAVEVIRTITQGDYYSNMSVYWNQIAVKKPQFVNLFKLYWINATLEALYSRRQNKREGGTYARTLILMSLVSE